MLWKKAESLWMYTGTSIGDSMSTRYPLIFAQSALDFWQHRLECMQALQQELGFDNSEEIEKCEDMIFMLECSKNGIAIEVEGDN